MRFRFPLALLGLSVWVGCPGSLENPERFTDGGPAPTCKAGIQIEQVLKEKCGTAAGCHTMTSPQQGLDLASAGVAARLLNKPSTMACSMAAYIDSTKPTGGVLLGKSVSTNPPCGGLMPPSGSPQLSADEKSCLRAWVADVASGGGQRDGGAGDGAAGDGG